MKVLRAAMNVPGSLEVPCPPCTDARKDQSAGRITLIETMVIPFSRLACLSSHPAWRDKCKPPLTERPGPSLTPLQRYWHWSRRRGRRSLHGQPIPKLDLPPNHESLIARGTYAYAGVLTFTARCAYCIFYRQSWMSSNTPTLRLLFHTKTTPVGG